MYEYLNKYCARFLNWTILNIIKRSEAYLTNWEEIC